MNHPSVFTKARNFSPWSVAHRPPNPVPTGALSGPIGGNGIGNQPKPNGNVWPVDPTIPGSPPWPVGPNSPLTPAEYLAGWQSPIGWTSIRNDNPDPFAELRYWAFDNEFVTDGSSPNVAVLRRPTGLNRAHKIPEGSTLQPPPGIDYIPLCSGDLPNVFPLRMAVQPSGQTVTEANPLLGANKYKVQLGDAIPNPAEHSTRIPFYIPEKGAGAYVLELFDLKGRETLQRLEVKERGISSLTLDLSELASGVYGYRLLENGKSLGTRKLVIVK